MTKKDREEGTHCEAVRTMLEKITEEGKGIVRICQRRARGPTFSRISNPGEPF